MSGKYADEEYPSDCMYPNGYMGPKPIADQIKAIAEIFGLDPSHAYEYAKNLSKLPDGAEGWFAVPSVNAIAAKHFPEITDDGEKYYRAVQLVHTKIAESRLFLVCSDEQITPSYLRVSDRTEQALGQIAEKQVGDILIIAAQLGMRHRGRSVRRAREVFTQSEFGLTSFAVGSIMLVHPGRLVPREGLGMICSGDEYNEPSDDDRFSRAPIFLSEYRDLWFAPNWFDCARSNHGSVTGFLPL